ncbi:sulfate permease, SulP family [Formivibrio citricus]|uniref:Sulfate permease, SulP family n=1 Tax=Formivibrio citricus TaxID=83765 RepID=A0A1I4XF41_9NEIS|nr:SulP family inorganic anion transporter [Formivibrio citricus]SFN24517.1 sulfate permease, SulP family [Formivibrio citricus]
MAVESGWRVLREYQRKWLKADLFAGVSVGVLVIPSVIAYAELAGLPPQTGLVTAVVGMLAYAFFGPSRQIIVGPDAAICLLIAASIAPLAEGDPWRAAGLASLLAIMVGAFMLIAALARMGAMADFLSKPILIGFMQGAALILIAAQLPRLGRIDVEQTDFMSRVQEFVARHGEWHWPSLLSGLGVLLVFAVLGRFAPRWPAPLLVFGVLIGLDFWLDFRHFGLAMVGPLPVPELGFSPPIVGVQEMIQLLPVAVGVALLAMPAGILLGRAFAERNHEASDANKELIGIGVASVLAGMVGGFALGASQSRTTLNHSAGAQSQLSGLIAALLVGFFLFFLTKALNHLPAVAVSALLIHAGMHLFEPRALRHLFKLDRPSAWFAVLTTAGVLVVGIVPGILVGIFLSLVHLIRSFSRPYDAMLCEVSGRAGFHDVGEAESNGAYCTMPGLIIYRFYAPLLFANAGYFVARLKGLVARNVGVDWVVIDAQAIVEIDVTAADMILALHRELREKGIHLRFARCNRPLRESLSRYGVVEALGWDHFHAHLDEAIEDFRQKSRYTAAHGSS